MLSIGIFSRPFYISKMITALIHLNVGVVYELCSRFRLFYYLNAMNAVLLCRRKYSEQILTPNWQAQKIATKLLY